MHALSSAESTRITRAGHGVPLGRYRVRASASAQATDSPLTRQQLADYLRQGCKPAERWRIGTEHEKFGFRKADKRPIDYEDVKFILQGLVSRFGWAPIVEGGFIIGASRAGQSVTLEPGGQLELSGAPVATMRDTCGEVGAHLREVAALAEARGVAFVGLGFQPKWSVADTPAMPKGRYKLMREYMPKVNLDFASEEDMVQKFRVSLALQPVATALFANSPFVDGKPCGFKSFRSNVWLDVDRARTGDLPFVFEPGFGFDQYVEYMLDVPMYFVYRDGQYIDATGQSFRDFLVGRLPALPGSHATMSDWEAHLTTAFPEVRLKRFLEMRGADNGPTAAICALPAFWVGLLYDGQALAEAAALVADWTAAERADLRVQTPVHALATPFRGGTLLEVSRRVIAMSKGGLQRRGLGEESFLKYVEDIAASGRTSADVLLENYEARWGHRVDPVFDDPSYLYF